MCSILKILFYTVVTPPPHTHTSCPLIHQSQEAKGNGKNIKWVQWTCCNLSGHSCCFLGEVWNPKCRLQCLASLTVTPLELYLGIKIHSTSYYMSSEHFGLLARLRNIVFFPSSDFAYFVPSAWNAPLIPASCPSTPTFIKLHSTHRFQPQCFLCWEAFLTTKVRFLCHVQFLIALHVFPS